tara:strand:- start:2339 stop:2647 length:309 start_codon:yes stop_codon:yes gene_type:complete
MSAINNQSSVIPHSNRPDPVIDPYRKLAGAVIWSGLKTLKSAVTLNKKEDIKKEKTFLLSDSCFHQLLSLKDETYLTMIKIIEKQEDWMNATKEERKMGIRK